MKKSVVTNILVEGDSMTFFFSKVTQGHRRFRMYNHWMRKIMNLGDWVALSCGSLDQVTKKPISWPREESFLLFILLVISCYLEFKYPASLEVGSQRHYITFTFVFLFHFPICFLFETFLILHIYIFLLLSYMIQV